MSEVPLYPNPSTARLSLARHVTNPPNQTYMTKPTELNLQNQILEGVRASPRGKRPLGPLASSSSQHRRTPELVP